jgi:hypothetical protein
MCEQESSDAAAQPAKATARPATHSRDEIGPVFIAGRQHSGNTVAALVFGMVPECCAINVEGWFFEHRALVDKIRDPAQGARYVVELLRLEDRSLSDRTREWLVRWHEEHSGATSVDVYREAMRFVTESSGKRFWVRRATSYIVYAGEILTLMPEARMLYLLRNPYDLCASLKRRDPRLDRFGGCVISWNRGLREALKLQETYPDRMRVVRYEDMVTKPVETFRGIFDFVGVPFREQYLGVPHVNRSEAVEAKSSASHGLNPSRVYYYTSILRPAEVAAVSMLVWKEKLLEYYTDLPDHQHRLSTRIGALGLLALSPFNYAVQQVRSIFRHDPAWQVRRLARRVRMLLR